jgi:ABC-type dipeptide/oligopeptide/nickel transport system ATPase component
MSDSLLNVTNLQTHFHTEEGKLPAVDGVTFSVPKGKTLAIVGESGCGKSVTAYSILRLIQPPGEIVGGAIELKIDDELTVDIVKMTEKSDKLYHVRGGVVSMIFQEPMTALSPVHSVGNQICEAILSHQEVSKAEAEKLAVEMLRRVGIPGPEKRLTQYPFEFSGGMRQRVMIAMALVCKPKLLIADEPTTALDVTVQAQILKVIKDLQAEMGTSVLLITHDLGVVAQTADEVAVMYLGRVVEQGPGITVLDWHGRRLEAPAHPAFRAGDRVCWAIPSTQVILHRADQPGDASGTRLSGRIDEIVALSESTSVLVSIEGRDAPRLSLTVPARFARRADLVAGSPVSVLLLGEGIHIMPAATLASEQERQV